MKIKKLPQVDIVIAGGGTAGCAAAVAAARAGRKVVLIEEQNCPGGVSTSGGVGEWFAGINGVGDIFDTVKAGLENFGAVYGNRFNSEYLKIVWQLLLEETGVEIMLHSSVIDVLTEGRLLKSVIIASGSHIYEIASNCFIDATGEGDLAYLSGADYSMGHAESGYTLHMSLIFYLFDTGTKITPYLPKGLKPINSQEELPGLLANIRLPDGRIYCNMTKITCMDPTDPLDLTKAELEARKQMFRIIDYLQRTKYKTYSVCSSGQKIGIREGRRITGDYVINSDDILKGEARVHPDGVAVATSQIDFHSLTKTGHTGWRQEVKPYQIPLRALISKDFDNLLMAGKCISGDQIAMSSYRMTPTCCAMGQAAGSAGALFLDSGKTNVRDIDIQALRAQLQACGMELDPDKADGFHVKDPCSDKKDMV